MVVIKKFSVMGLKTGGSVLLFFVNAIFCFNASVYSQTRSKRTDGYIGLHFDFHAKDINERIGGTTTPGMIDSIINIVRPDWLQMDCKGHPGISSYPTKVGNPAPGILKDPLKIWRDATAKKNVLLYVHYSGVEDAKSVTLHPDWAVVDGEGKQDKSTTSIFSPYVDKILIPQLIEIADYGVNGVWIDGDCYMVKWDYAPNARLAFKEYSVKRPVAPNSTELNWKEFPQFTRQAYRQYLNHYITELKKSRPNFEVCVNWAFTDNMPEKVSTNVDFLSGDLSPENSVNAARVSARYISMQGKPWDLMSWSLAATTNEYKPSIQLKREAAMVISRGGSYQVYFPQRRDGSVNLGDLDVMAEVASFCRERRIFCQNAVSVPQVGLVLSTEGHYNNSKGVFYRDFAHMKGILEALVNSQLQVDLVSEHHLDTTIQKFPLIIIPEWTFLPDSFITKLKNYVQAGGNLLLIGPNSASMFQKELKVQLDPNYSAGNFTLSYTGGKLQAEDKFQMAKLGDGVVRYGTISQNKNTSQSPIPAASITSFGKGKMAAIYFNMGERYNKTPDEEQRLFLSGLVDILFPNPIVKVTGSNEVDVVVMQKSNKLMVNLINTSGPHRTQPIVKWITPLDSIKVTIRQTKSPLKVTYEPNGKELPFVFKNGEIQVNIPPVEVHNIIVVTPAK